MTNQNDEMSTRSGGQWDRHLRYELHRPLISALTDWGIADASAFGTSNFDRVFSIQRPLPGGLSGADVLLVDIHQSQEAITDSSMRLEGGQYILKINYQNKTQNWKSGPSEADRHRNACEHNAEFAKKHIPQLVRCNTFSGFDFLLYDVAGDGLAFSVTSDSLHSEALTALVRQISVDLLTNLNNDFVYNKGSARSILKKWLGYRLDRTNKEVRLNHLSHSMSEGKPKLIVGKNVFVDPLYFCFIPALESETIVFFSGLSHNDLHLRNILTDRRVPITERYWIIDFALSDIGPLLYDHSYLEFSLLYQHLVHDAPERLITVLRAANNVSNSYMPDVMPADVGLLKTIQALRSSLNDWQKEKEPKRKEPVHRQLLLSRVAAGLTWANKLLPTVQAQEMAYIYAAYAADEYITLFHPGLALERSLIGKEQGKPSVDHVDKRIIDAPLSPKDLVATDDANPDAWDIIWKAARRFDPEGARYVLVCGELSNASSLGALGALPWSAVIDLDPQSDTSGLYAHTNEYLKRSRSVQIFGLRPEQVDFNRGTSWMLAGGWPSRYEPIPTNDRDWQRKYAGAVRKLCGTLLREVIPLPIIIVILPGSNVSSQRLRMILESIDEELGQHSQVLLCAPQDIVEGLDSDLYAVSSSLSPLAFAAGVNALYGNGRQIEVPTIPGINGPISIPVEDLRNFQEDFTVLHSAILTDPNDPTGYQSDHFWRGSPPSWSDLHSSADIVRDLHPRLISELIKRLDERRNYTVQLYHKPGAGGTTVALRAAWELRNRYPTIVIHRSSKNLIDRIDRLFQLSQLPILIIAEASVITPAINDLLYYGLSTRNVRGVVLHVIRTTRVGANKSFVVGDPMTTTEAVIFGKAYGARTSDLDRRAQMNIISSSSDPKFVQYRSPFFYGLIAFDKDFTKIGDFVHLNIVDASDETRRALRYLALVTLYSQATLDEGFIQNLLGLSQNQRLDVEEAFGTGAARLVLHQGRRLKLLHPLIGREVLQQLLGGTSWKENLKELAIEFINEVVEIQGSDSQETHNILVELFIRRSSAQRDVFDGTRDSAFSELIADMPRTEGRLLVLEALVKVCPTEAHYWNHLGRFYIYELKREFDRAEEHLLKAVELEPDDAFHRHTLGMVRRFWIEDTIRSLRYGIDNVTPNELLQDIAARAALAASDFAEARRLDSADPHGYITHIQMILHISSALIEAHGRGQDLSAVTNRNSQAARWLRENVSVAEDLLADVQHLRGPGKSSRFENNCLVDLANLYGDFASIIRNFEKQLSDNGDPSYYRLLSRVYLADGKREWDQVPTERLRRIVTMMENNLRQDPTNERDIRMWFQASRRLPEFNYFDALDRLGAWASRSDILDAHYYLAILHFLSWYRNQLQDETIIARHLERCKELARGRRQHSYEWLGVKPSWCPIVNHTQLGEHDPERRFFTRTDLLARMRGTIETIDGPQKGTIRLGRVLRAFFVPGTHFFKSSDVNEQVDFYLGFAYDGLRAWEPRRLATPNQVVDKGEIHLRKNDDIAVDMSTPGNEALADHVHQFVLDEVERAVDEDHDLWLNNLKHFLNSRFGSGYLVMLGFQRLEALISSYPEIELIKDGQDMRLVYRSAS